MTRDPARVQRKPFLTPIWLTVLAALIGFSVLVFAAWIWGTADSTTVVVIRQADKDMQPGTDPPLSAAGEARAVLLSRLFGDPEPGRLEAIYVAPTRRSRATAAPLAAELGMIPIVATEDARHLARRVLREHAGGRILVVAGGTAATDIVETLSGTKQSTPLGEREYGTMYIISVPRIGRPNLLRIDY